jgi:hypothetical protein
MEGQLQSLLRASVVEDEKPLACVLDHQVTVTTAHHTVAGVPRVCWRWATWCLAAYGVGVIKAAGLIPA